MFFDSGAKTYFRSGGTSTSPLLDGFIFRNGQAGTDLLYIDGSGNSTQLGTLLVEGITCMSTLNVSGITILNGSVGLNNSSPYLTLDVGSTNANHNIGRSIINGTIHDANKRDSLSIGRWDGTNPYINFFRYKIQCNNRGRRWLYWI
jgi:hypothetical protein